MKKKYLITMAGGIGNQMLQYSLFTYLKTLGEKCQLYKKPDSQNLHHGFDIDSIFSAVRFNKRNKFYLNQYIKFYVFIHKINSYIKKKNNLNPFLFFINRLPLQVVNFPIWENYHFLNQIEIQLQEVFKFPKYESVKNKELHEIIQNTNSVSVHIRRGDYIKDPNWRSILGDICDTDYYDSALLKIKQLVDSPQFIIFSDDIDWVIDNLNIEGAIYVNWNNGNDSYRDMQLMANCKHNIIANSTFSLMSAWLNNYKNKTVIGPSKWSNYFNDTFGKKIMSPKWFTIDVSNPNISLVMECELSKNVILNILGQTYTDFEVLVDDKLSMDDSRIKLKKEHTVQGNHTFIINDASVVLFSNKNYLVNLLKDSYQK